VDELTALNVVGNNEESLGWVETLAELNDALQIEVKDVCVLKIQFALLQAVLVALDHHEDHLLVSARALEEVLKESLFLDLFFSLLHVRQVQHLVPVLVVLVFVLSGTVGNVYLSIATPCVVWPHRFLFAWRFLLRRLLLGLIGLLEVSLVVIV